MQKALVHSQPSSASILLPAASTSTDRERCSRSPGNRGKGFVLQDLPVAKGLFENGSHVNSGFLHLVFVGNQPSSLIAAAPPSSLGGALGPHRMKVSHDFEPWSGYWGSLFALRQNVRTSCRYRGERLHSERSASANTTVILPVDATPTRADNGFSATPARSRWA
jgi:hypothetical protein